jgi:peptidyl-prolyl cis-trans isomerase D
MRSAAKYIWWIIVLSFIIGFVFYETSGLSSRNRTPGTTIARVNGETVSLETWEYAKRNRIQEEQQQSSRPLTLDDERRLEDETFNQMVTDILLEQEYKRRGITVSDQEIQQAALERPYPQFLQNPEFQTEGRFDIDKYRRFLSSPAAKQQGVLLALESYYRRVIPQQKLFEQVASGVYVTDGQLWRMWEDTHDSAQVSFVALTPSTIPDSQVKVTSEEVRRYFEAHQKELGDRPGRAVLSLVTIPRTITPADSAAVRAHAVALRNEILGGAKFDDVAKRESADSGSAAQGGSLGRVTKGRFVKEFENAAFALKPGEISQPVLSQFGYHIIKVDERKGDTIAVRHILLRIQQGDSSAAVTDRKADALAKAAGSEKPALFDSVTKQLGLQVSRVVAVEGEPLTWNQHYVPSISAWAFMAKPGEVSDLVDAEDAYYLARLDSLTPGGKPNLASASDEIRRELVREKKIELLEARAKKVTDAIASGKKLEQAAQAEGLKVQKSPMFTRAMPVPGLGQVNEAIGAAFALPVGAVSDPVATKDGVFVLRVDRRVNADRKAWEAQKKTQREQVLARFRQQRVQEFLAALRQNARVVDNRKALQQASRQAAS